MVNPFGERSWRAFGARWFAIAGCLGVLVAACDGAVGPVGDRSDEARGDASAAGRPIADASPSDGARTRTDAGSEAQGPDGGPAVDGGTGGMRTDPEFPACRVVEDWTCVSVPRAGPYGQRSFPVRASQNWINSGLFLREGESVSVSVGSGLWSIDGVQQVDASGSTASRPDHSRCPVGALAARVGLHYKDDNIFCGDGDFTFVAPRDGIVFVGAFPGNDLGETYESRHRATGELEVTLTSDGATVPSILPEMAASYPYQDVESGWLEVVTDHAILTLPVSTVAQDRDTIADAASRIDAIYEVHRQLRGAVPFLGQRVRFFPDATTVGWMLAGNPIRMQPPLVEGEPSLRISRSGEPGFDPWGFAHELGHTFNHVGAVWTHQLDGSLEVWPNIFSLHSYDRLGLPLNNEAAMCAARGAAYKARGTYEDLRADVFLWLCFFVELEEEFGWQIYERFFADLNRRSNREVGSWGYVFQTLSEAAGRDLTAEFDVWRIPRN